MKRLLPVLMGFALLLLSSTEGWSLPPCQGSPTSSGSTAGSWTDCVGTIIFSDGSKYVGEYKDGKWNGQGTLYYAYGGVEQEGIFENNRLLYAKKSPTKGWSLPPCPGNYYRTTWTDCFGTVTNTYPHGNKYVGEFKDGKFHGQGTSISADGRVKEGIWENDEFVYAKKLSPTVTEKNSSSDDMRSRLLLIKRLESKGLITKKEAASKRQETLGSSSTDEQDAKPSVTAKKSPTKSNTFLLAGNKVGELRKELRRLQINLSRNNSRLQQLRASSVQSAESYQRAVAIVNSRLQVGTSPGNPVLVQRFNTALSLLNSISEDLGSLNKLTSQVTSDSTLAAFLSENTRTMDENHPKLAVLKDEVNRTVVLVERVLKELSEDIQRHTNFVATERSNLNRLSESIKTGEIIGARTQRSISSRPLMVIRFDRKDVAYEQALYNAVSRVLERRPGSTFSLVAIAPNLGGAAKLAVNKNKARRNAENVLRSLQRMGLSPNRVSLSERTARATSTEVHLYLNSISNAKKPSSTVTAENKTTFNPEHLKSPVEVALGPSPEHIFEDRLYTRIADSDLALRAGPDTSLPKNKYVLIGDVIVVYESEDEHWYQYRFYDNQRKKPGKVIGYLWLGPPRPPTVTAKKTPKVKPAPTKPAITPAQDRDTTPPTIQIASSITVKQDSPTIRGRVNDDNKVVQVSVNGVATSFSGQTFSFNRYVPPSGTKVTIEAVDEWGNRSTKVVRLIRKKVETATRRFDPLDPTKFSAKRNPNAVALIIGITKYKRTVEAKFAGMDAQFFSDYARRKLGVPQSNIKVLTNEKAGSTDILEAAADWLPSATQADKSDVYIFYAGHGLSSADGKELYLLPYNGSPKLLEDTALRRNKLFKIIARARPRSVTVFLDTCYSGTTRTEETLVASRRILINPVEQLIPSRFTVFSAASMTQTAQMLDETGHGLFSYWLMKGMEGGADKNKDRKITAGELHNYVRNNVTRLRHDQTPQLKGNKETVLMRW